jgi:hypothetical protein
MKFLTAAPIIFGCMLLGCSSALAGGSKSTTPPAGVAQMGNVFVSSPVLPQDLKRIVMLPPACGDFSGPMSDACQILGPVLQAELIKTGRFEVVAADPEAVRNCTGGLGWTGEETLPAKIFDSLKQYYGCDAVLFCHLTAFRSSAPLAIGWRLKLVDVKTGAILWAADEIYDAKNPVVAKAAERFERQQQPHQSAIYHVYSFLAWCINTPTRSALDDQWNILHSPRYFGEFSASELLKTLPAR